MRRAECNRIFPGYFVPGNAGGLRHRHFGLRILPHTAGDPVDDPGTALAVHDPVLHHAGDPAVYLCGQPDEQHGYHFPAGKAGQCSDGPHVRLRRTGFRRAFHPDGRRVRFRRGGRGHGVPYPGTGDDEERLRPRLGGSRKLLIRTDRGDDPAVHGSDPLRNRG